MIVNPIPGQEVRNTYFLLEKGAAVMISELPLLTHKLQQLFGEHGDELKRLQHGAKSLGCMSAANGVVEWALKHGARSQGSHSSNSAGAGAGAGAGGATTPQTKARKDSPGGSVADRVRRRRR